MSKTPYFKTVYAGAPKCAQCGRTFNRNEDRFKNDWGEICRGCWDGGATLLKPTPDSALPRRSAPAPAKVRCATRRPQRVSDWLPFVQAVDSCLRAAGRAVDATQFRQYVEQRTTVDRIVALAERYVEIVEDAQP